MTCRTIAGRPCRAFPSFIHLTFCWGNYHVTFGCLPFSVRTKREFLCDGSTSSIFFFSLFMVNIYYFNDTGSHQCHIPPLLPSGLFSIGVVQPPQSLGKRSRNRRKIRISTHPYINTQKYTRVFKSDTTWNECCIDMCVCVCSRFSPLHFIYLWKFQVIFQPQKTLENQKKKLCLSRIQKGSFHISPLFL